MKTFIKRFFAVPLMFVGAALMLIGIYMNVFVQLPTALGNASEFASGAGVIVGTILGTGVWAAICVAIIALACALWRNI